jgi:hypothetical protein
MAVSNVSDHQVQSTYRVGVLENQSRVKSCEFLEEKEGRINSDLLNRFVILGGPFVQAGPDMQDLLVKQVHSVYFQF